MKNIAVFLDRDGVINDVILKNGKPHPPASVTEMEISSEVLPALTMLKSLGYLLIGATNQPDVARGITDKVLVDAIHQKLMYTLPLDEIRVCFHDDNDNCSCRKPSPGLLLDASIEHNIDLSRSIMIGDRWRDIEAGYRAGCKTIWINRNYQERGPQYSPDFIATSLMQAANWIEKTHSLK